MRLELTDLQAQLQEMTAALNASQHATRLTEISKTHPNSIVPLDSEWPVEEYTCAMHALELVGDRSYACIAQFGLGRTYAGADFIRWLIATGQLEETNVPELRDLIIYFKNGEFKHIGLWNTKDRVCSKWGTGLLYEHAIDEVPSSYGDETKFFKGISKSASISAFYEFARECGVPEEYIEHCRKK